MTQAEEKFEPKKHVMQLKSREGSKDYLPVQWRLVWFREVCPQGTIDTEEMDVDLDREVEEEVSVWNNEKRRSEKVVKRAKGYARYKATVTDGKGGRATGTKSENAASFPDFVEKAETGAIGRALAGLGYGTQFAPELSEDHRIVDSPVVRTVSSSDGAQNGASNHANASETREPVPSTPRPTAQSMNIANDAMTSDQLNAITNLYKELGKDVPADVRSLTRMKAAGLIQALTAEVTVARQNKAANREKVAAK
jgi:hypothetical protein